MAEAHKTLAFVESVLDKPDSPAILAGDLNTVSGTPELDIMTRSGWLPADSDVADQPTWDPAQPNCTIQTSVEREGARGPGEGALYAAFSKRCTKLDHCLVREGRGRAVRAKSSRIVMTGGRGRGAKGEKRLPPSDHYGVLVDFDVGREGVWVMGSARKGT